MALRAAIVDIQAITSDVLAILSEDTPDACWAEYHAALVRAWSLVGEWASESLTGLDNSDLDILRRSVVTYGRAQEANDRIADAYDAITCP